MSRVAPVGVAVHAARTAVAQRVEVYSYDAETGTDTLVQYTGSDVSNDSIARQAFEQATKVAQYYREHYARDGYDGKGAVTKVRVHAPDLDGSTPMNNARWYNDEGRLWLGDGDGTLFSPLGSALDVVAHEFTHGVVDSEVALDYEGQEGALNESWADVLASGVDGNWQVAEDAFTPGVAGDSLRDMARPAYGDARALPPWVTEVHDLSGIPSLAAVKVAAKIGPAQMRKIWYAALTDHLSAHTGFSGARKATLDAAAELAGRDSEAYQAVKDAWDAVGVSDRTPKVRKRSTVERFDPRAIERNGDQPTARAIARQG